MTRQKDLKRVIRARMEKTGESYTAARMHIVKPDYAKLAGMSDAAVKKGTGCDWTRWVKTLDDRGAEKMSHAQIAKLTATYGAGSWWAQMVAVGYERIKGLRARGQMRGGTWTATKSKTFAAPVAKVFRAFAKSLPAGATIRTKTVPKSMRLTWEDGSNVAVGFYDKGAKSTVALEHTGLKSKDDVARVKGMWGERLNVLSELL
jgi:hypothetical protein